MPHCVNLLDKIAMKNIHVCGVTKCQKYVEDKIYTEMEPLSPFVNELQCRFACHFAAVALMLTGMFLHHMNTLWLCV